MPLQANEPLRPAEMVADLETDVERTGYDWTLPSFATMNDRVLFSGFDGVHGLELWASDGTADGTVMVRDICPGDCAGIRGQELAVLGGEVFFVASDGVYGEELWVSDGTSLGTRLIADVRPGLEGSNPLWLTVVGNRLFFIAHDGTTGRELWVTDGTSAGTRLVRDVFPGESPGGGAPPGLLTAVDESLLLFFANDGMNGTELWRSDGTEAGTKMVKDVRPGPSSSVPYVPPPSEAAAFSWRPAVLDGTLYFRAQDGSTGTELFRSDGTASGTRLVADLEPGPVASDPEELFAFEGSVFFRASVAETGKELYQTTPAGAEIVIDLNPGPGSSYPSVLGAPAGKLLFAATEPSVGRELWETDGTASGTKLAAEIVPGPEYGTFFTSYGRPIEAGGQLFFVVDDGAHGFEWWVTDGSQAGTHLTRDINPGATHSALERPFGIALPDGSGLFGFVWSLQSGLEPWRSDGTEAGTLPVADLNHQRSSFSFAGGYGIGGQLAANPSEVLFTWPQLERGFEPWSSDGTEIGTGLLGDLEPGREGSDPYSLSWSGEEWFFGAKDPAAESTSALWIHDGSDASPRMVVSSSGESFESPDLLLSGDGKQLFNSGSRLWITDGSPAGSIDLGARATSAARLGETFLIRGERLERLDDGGLTEILVDLAAAGSDSPFRLAVTTGPRFFFYAADTSSGWEPWTSDGTLSGTLQLGDLRPGGEGSLALRSERPFPDGGGFVPVGGLVFFTADDGTHGEELWVSDGTTLGTYMLADLFPGAMPSSPRWLTPLGDTVYFVATSPAHGRELWRSDGTPEGTELVGDLIPGTASSVPRHLAAGGGRLFFAADHAQYGVELWVFDDGDLRLHQDLYPGPGSSSPSWLTASERQLWFVATDGEHGFELWTLPSLDAIFSDGFESGGTAAWSATSQ